jgi:hypothetical protein
MRSTHIPALFLSAGCGDVTIEGECALEGPTYTRRL